MDTVIQATLDKITALKSSEDSWAAAMDLITKTNADQAAQIADLQAKIAAGTDVTAADLDALAPAAAAANTPAAPSP